MEQTLYIIAEIETRARKHQETHGLDMIGVDYVQIMTHPKADTLTAAVGATSKALKGLAKTLQVRVVVLSQLSRASVHDGRRPSLHDLRESGNLEQDSDHVWFLHCPLSDEKRQDAEEHQEKIEMMLIIAKQRQGVANLKVDTYFSGIRRRQYIRLPDDSPKGGKGYWSENL